MGKGAVGGWRSKLTQEEVDAVEHVSRDGLSRLGYPTLEPTP